MIEGEALADAIARHGAIVLDGALATELERRGADLNDPLWSARVLIEQPQLIGQVHLDYFEAGADVATTASYQATFEGFARRGIDARAAAALLRRSVALACEARERFWAGESRRAGRMRPLVAASVGPYGAMLADGSEYRGRYGVPADRLLDFHRRRIEVLADCGADLLACETVPSLDEALAIAGVLGEFGVPAWLSFSCRDGEHVSEGQRLADCVGALEGCAQVLAIGVNCTAPGHVESLIGHARSRTAKPIVAYPNSGERYDASQRRWIGHAQPHDFAAAVPRWHAAGARLIGGCCRTTPAHILVCRMSIDAFLRSRDRAGDQHRRS